MVRATRVSRLVKRSLIAALIAEPWENVGGQSEIKKKKKSWSGTTTKDCDGAKRIHLLIDNP